MAMGHSTPMMVEQEDGTTMHEKGESSIDKGHVKSIAFENNKGSCPAIDTMVLDGGVSYTTSPSTKSIGDIRAALTNFVTKTVPAKSRFQSCK
ncbi:hypothetical protein GOP47_0030598 [Adiantum capillus-veneris]|nr:hypothetical protein GOP47_0030598 [Adiantum capillus-veneris]